MAYSQNMKSHRRTNEMGINPSPARQGVDRDNIIKIYVLAVIAILFVYLNTTVAQSDFSDTDTYLFYVDSIYFFREPDWWKFEALSKIFMLVMRDLAQDTVYSVYIYRYILIFLFPFSIFYLYRKASWQALVIALALYGPLLGLITMRATPAYVLAAVAAVAAIEGKWRSIAYILAGFLFHVSTALAVPATLLVLALNKYGIKSVKSRYIYGGFLIFSLIYAVIASAGVQYFLDFIGSFAYLAKYSSYIPGANETAQVVAESDSKIIHYVFMGAVVSLGAFLIFKAREDQGLEKLFIAFSLVIYVILFFASSPVVSLRYSPFFILPVLARIDISFRGGLGGISSIAIAVGSAIVFVLSLQQVIYAQ